MYINNYFLASFFVLQILEICCAKRIISVPSLSSGKRVNNLVKTNVAKESATVPSRTTECDKSVLGGTSKFGFPFTGDTAAFSDFTRVLEEDWNEIWTESKMVPDKVPDFPDNKLRMNFASGVTIRPNDSLTTGLLLQPPQITWDNLDSSALYTGIIVDVDVFLGPDNPVTNFIHLLATNIQGNDISTGTINYGYIPPFAFLYTPENGLSKDPKINHRYAFLVFKQKGKINLPVEEKICQTMVLKRAQNYQDIVKANNLGNPVAGNFLRAVYGDGETANRFICQFTKCTEHPFPALINGVNDGPECQP